MFILLILFRNRQSTHGKYIAKLSLEELNSFYEQVADMKDCASELAPVLIEIFNRSLQDDSVLEKYGHRPCQNDIGELQARVTYIPIIQAIRTRDSQKLTRKAENPERQLAWLWANRSETQTPILGFSCIWSRASRRIWGTAHHWSSSFLSSRTQQVTRWSLWLTSLKTSTPKSDFI